MKGSFFIRQEALERDCFVRLKVTENQQDCTNQLMMGTSLALLLLII